MSFELIRSSARSRYGEVQLYLNYLTSLEPRNVTDPIPLELKIMKGLFQVHLYSALEKTVNELIENTLLYIGSNSIKNNHYAVPFNTISMVEKLRSFKDCGYKNFFDKAIDIFAEMNSSNIVPINESTFSSQLQNVWTETIEEILKSFGISGFIIEPRVKTTINELVEKRNAVAHGRESASAVGERFRTNILRVKMEEITLFSNKLIDTFETYYSSKNFLKSHAKKHYIITAF